KYVIIGHSERRAYYHETAEILKSKVRMALGYGLSPIFCVGEVLAEREAGKHFEVISAQIADSLFHLSVDQFCRLTIAYEPVWAIGTGKTASAAQIQEIHEHIRQLIIDRYGRGTAFNCSLIYGGSCNGSNAKEIFSNLDVDGGLIGGASLTVDKFMQIIEAF
ncbi:MAG: triose-phosphate isomerase, partial [Tannerellaceae bacterium]